MAVAACQGLDLVLQGHEACAHSQRGLVCEESLTDSSQGRRGVCHGRRALLCAAKRKAPTRRVRSIASSFSPQGAFVVAAERETAPVGCQTNCVKGSAPHALHASTLECKDSSRSFLLATFALFCFVSVSAAAGLGRGPPVFFRRIEEGELVKLSRARHEKVSHGKESVSHERSVWRCEDKLRVFELKFSHDGCCVGSCALRRISEERGAAEDSCRCRGRRRCGRRRPFKRRLKTAPAKTSLLSEAANALLRPLLRGGAARTFLRSSEEGAL